MEKTLQENEIAIGDEIRLRSYQEYSDYRRHKMQSAIVHGFKNNGSNNIAIRWNDNIVSYTSIKNIIKLNGEWDL